MAELRIGALICDIQTYLPTYRSVGVNIERRRDHGEVTSSFQIRLWWWEFWAIHRLRKGGNDDA